ncbi:MAG: DUF3857 domain-containing protein, partial [Acidobacteriota bacterium]
MTRRCRAGAMGRTARWLVWPAGALIILAVAAEVAGAEFPQHPQLARQPPSSWVDIAPIDGAETPPSGQGSTWLFFDTQIRLGARGEPAETFERMTWRIDSRSALEAMSSWSNTFLPDRERLVVHSARVRRDGAWSERLDSSRAALVDSGEDLDEWMIDGSKRLTLILDDVRVGDVVDVQWSRVDLAPEFGGRFATSEPLAYGIAAARLRLRLVHPAERAVQVRVDPGLETAAADLAPVETRQNGLVEREWDRRDLADVEILTDAPSWFVALPQVEMADFASWAEVVAWGRPLYRTESFPELDDLVARIEADAGNDREAALREARRFAQDEIRYFSDTVRGHSFAPHPLPETLRKRYGDCKDKTLLLTTLLQRLGFDAVPAFVHTELREHVADRLPSPAAFDHAIVHVLAFDEELWIDPTISLQGGGSRPSIPDYGRALPLRPGTVELATVGRQGTASSIVEYIVDTETGARRIEVHSTYAGASGDEIRDMLAGTSPEELQDQYETYYEDSSGLELESAPLKIDDRRSDGTVTIVEAYTHDDVDWIELLPLLADTALPRPDAAERTMPLAIAHPESYFETIRLRRTDPFDSLSELAGRADTIDTPWFRAVSEPIGDRAQRIAYRLETRRDH